LLSFNTEAKTFDSIVDVRSG